VSDRGPHSLLPLGVARLLGFAALATLAALEWQRLMAGMPAWRALLWVAVAVAAGAAVLACDRLPERRLAAGVIASAIGGLLAAVAVSGLDLALLKPRSWQDLAEGFVSGAHALGTVRLPYEGADPWPRATLELLGSGLLTAAALLACWPRAETRSRGYPFLALGLLMVLVASPVVSLGGAAPLALGATITALTVAFLWLERLPLRPGLGVAALLGLALAGALPLATMADRGEPWFDYRAFAESLGPDDPVRFSWRQGYGPIDWPRDGREMFRVRSDEPLYWKAVDLEEFDGREWRQGRGSSRLGYESEIRDDWRTRPGWRHDIEVSLRRLRTRDVLAPGTVMSVRNATGPLHASPQPGRWVAARELRRGDSYSAEVYVPTPSAAELHAAEVAGFGPDRNQELEITVPLEPGRAPTPRELGSPSLVTLDSAVIHFPPFGEPGGPDASFPEIGRSLFGGGGWVLQRSGYRRTWRLAQRLRRGTESPYDYILRVDDYLRTDFAYSERPTAPEPGRLPLDTFLIDAQDGYCQHFAGAMALLLRMGGIPARVATGFSPGGFSDRRDAWIVRDTDAHAWVEAWFDDIGWVTFDPTPASTPARSQIAALEPPSPVEATTSAADDTENAGEGAQPGGGELRADLLRNDPLLDGSAGSGRGVPWWAWALAGAAMAAAGTLALRTRRRRRLRGRLSPLERAIAELESALRRSGRPAPPAMTLRGLERRLGASPDATAYLRALSAGRYGPRATPPTPAQRRAMRRALAQGVGPVGRLRAWWALPPRPR
jgi:protein-glutamine gamma-glutamyltransferase